MRQVWVVGPFVLSLAMLLSLAAIAAGLAAACWLARDQRAEVQTTLWRAVGLGLLAARLAFIWRWFDAYAAHPIDMLDLRDGGWDGTVGLAAACLVALASCNRRPSMRKPIAAAFIAAALVWLPGSLWLIARPGPGPQLPDLSLPTLDGPERSLASFAGQPTIVNLWATWCPPCRQEMPMLAQAQAANPQVHFVFINQGETRLDVSRFVAAQRLSLNNLLLDERSTAGARFDQRAFPTTLFFDANGRLIDTRIGELSRATLAQWLGEAGPARAAARP